MNNVIGIKPSFTTLANALCSPSPLEALPQQLRFPELGLAQFLEALASKGCFEVWNGEESYSSRPDYWDRRDGGELFPLNLAYREGFADGRRALSWEGHSPTLRAQLRACPLMSEVYLPVYAGGQWVRTLVLCKDEEGFWCRVADLEKGE